MAGTRTDLRIYDSPDDTDDAADRLFAGEAYRSARAAAGLEPFGPDWFRRIAELRYARLGRWIPAGLEFAKHRGESVLCLGEGLGTDWVQYAKHGAEVTAAVPSQEQLAFIRGNFDAHELPATLLHAAPDHLPIASASIDVACVFGLMGELDDPQPVTSELYRVLRPGGKVIVVAPARHDSQYWANLLLPWRRWFGPASPGLHRAATARTLRHDFAAFAEPKVSRRHLRRGELPHLWRFFPLSVLERVMGRYLILKAFKPLSAAVAERLAA